MAFRIQIPAFRPVNAFLSAANDYFYRISPVGMKILIVEDEVLIAEDLKDNLAAFGYREVSMVHNRKDALQQIGQWAPDLVLLDIRMEQELDGIHIGRELRERHDIPFIYVTSHSDMSMVRQIMETYPAGYITKPFKKTDLLANVLRVTQERGAAPKTESAKVVFKDGHETVILEESKLFYVESEGNYVMVHHRDGKRLIRQSMEAFGAALNTDRFLRIHRCYIANLSLVERYTRTELRIAGRTLPVSRTFQGEFLKRIGEVG